ncbi:hypothetical protein E4U21_001673 [Claviceps maximensis]|nr:hypothetical protein E4U21_001673 [Claviceps maximensis]
MSSYFRLFNGLSREVVGSGMSMSRPSRRANGDKSDGTMRSNDAPSFEIRDTGAEEVVRILSEKIDNLPQKLCKLFQKTCSESDKQLEKKIEELDLLKLELNDLKKSLQKEKEFSKEKIKESGMLKLELDDLEKNLQKQKELFKNNIIAQAKTIQQLKEEKNKFREMILGGPARQKVSDEVIKERFASVRQQIQAIAHSLLLKVDRPLLDSNERNQSELEFQQEYNLYSVTDRIFLIRAKIYEVISRFILRGGAFGLLSTSQNPQRLQYFQNTKEAELEKALCNFESHLKAKEDPTPAGDVIWNVLSPLLKYRIGNSKLLLDVRQLCEDAYSLRLLTLQSKDRYHFEAPNRGESFDAEKGFVEPCGVLGGGDRSTIVAFSICGALKKETGTGDEDIYCLEPAHVVVQPRKHEQSSNDRASS